MTLPFLQDNRPLSATRRLHIHALTPEQLDTYLEMGCYRIEQYIIYCEYTYSEQSGARGVIWTRVPLEGYSFSKSLRKLKRRVERRFQVRVVPAKLDYEHEHLYERYLTQVTGDRAANLQQVLFGDQPHLDLFNTLEVEIRLGDQLVGFSWFDRGATSLQSVIGVYDPDHASESLGFYTMLREIQYGLDEGLEHFYAGYILCHDTTMDYKLRTGSIEYLDRPTNTWRPYNVEESIHDNDPLTRTRDALTCLQARIDDASWSLLNNQHFTLGAYSPNLATCLAYPYALWHTMSTFQMDTLVIGWDSVTQHYELMRCLRGSLTSPEGQVLIDDLVVVNSSLGSWKTMEEVIDALDALI